MNPCDLMFGYGASRIPWEGAFRKPLPEPFHRKSHADLLAATSDMRPEVSAYADSGDVQNAQMWYDKA